MAAMCQVPWSELWGSLLCAVETALWLRLYVERPGMSAEGVQQCVRMCYW